MWEGVIFVLNPDWPQHLSTTTPSPKRVTDEVDVALFKYLVVRHFRLTGSVHDQAILENWSSRLELFWELGPKIRYTRPEGSR